MELVPPL